MHQSAVLLCAQQQNGAATAQNLLLAGAMYQFCDDLALPSVLPLLLVRVYTLKMPRYLVYWHEDGRWSDAQDQVLTK